MSEYPKTENLLRRDSESHRLIVGALRSPHFGQVKNWLVTEKIDGTNIRIVLDWGYNGERDEWRPVVDFRGRSDAAPVPGAPTTKKPEGHGLWKLLNETVTLDRAYRALKCIVHGGESDAELDANLHANPIKMVVYGEGYGAGIQKGASYNREQQLRIFDVRTYVGLAEHEHWGKGLWRVWDDVQVVSDVLGISTAPVLRLSGSTEWPLEAIVAYASEGVYSRVAAEENDAGFSVRAEGIVARTDPYLYDYRGNRVMFKLKSKDLP